MAIVKWAVSAYATDKPERKEYEKETAHFYVYRSRNMSVRRDAKQSPYMRYFDTESEAMQFIENRRSGKAEARRIDQIKRHAVELLEALENLVNADSVTMNAAMEAAESVIAKAKGVEK